MQLKLDCMMMLQGTSETVKVKKLDILLVNSCYRSMNTVNAITMLE